MCMFPTEVYIQMLLPYALEKLPSAATFKNLQKLECEPPMHAGMTHTVQSTERK